MRHFRHAARLVIEAAAEALGGFSVTVGSLTVALAILVGLKVCFAGW